MCGPSAPEKKARLRTASLDRFFHNLAPNTCEDSIPLDLPKIPPLISGTHQPSLFINPDAVPFAPEASLQETSVRTRPESCGMFSFGGGASSDTYRQILVKEEGTLSDFSRRNFISGNMPSTSSPYLGPDDGLLIDLPRMNDNCDVKIYMNVIAPGKDAPPLKLYLGTETATTSGMLGHDIISFT